MTRFRLGTNGSQGRIGRALVRLLRSELGSSDLTVGLLMTAAGAAMVGLTVPSLFKSSDTAARTFDRQVKILERGAGGAGGGAEGLSTGSGLAQSFDLGTPGRGAAITTGASPSLANGSSAVVTSTSISGGGSSQVASAGNAVVTSSGAPLAHQAGK